VKVLFGNGMFDKTSQLWLQLSQRAGHRVSGVLVSLVLSHSLMPQFSVCERFRFTKKFRKFRLGCKWNMTFWFVPLEFLCSIYRFLVFIISSIQKYWAVMLRVSTKKVLSGSLLKILENKINCSQWQQAKGYFLTSHTRTKTVPVASRTKWRTWGK